MSEDAQIRRANLASLQLGPSGLVAKLGRSYSFWRDILETQKSFGEKLARSIEDGLSLPRGWLDRPQGGRVVLDYAPRAAEPTPPAPPPLSEALPVVVSALSGLSPLQLGRALQALEQLADHPDRTGEVTAQIQGMLAQRGGRKHLAA